MLDTEFGGEVDVISYDCDVDAEARAACKVFKIRPFPTLDLLSPNFHEAELPHGSAHLSFVSPQELHFNEDRTVHNLVQSVIRNGTSLK